MDEASRALDSAVPQFPNYPKPQGIPVADPKFHSPLYKMMRMMMKPKKIRSTISRKKLKKKSLYA